MPTEYEKLRQARNQQIKRLVCSGGGAKGSAYPGSYKAMVDTGVMKDVEACSGASAGAITATFMALNMSPTTLRQQLLSTNFKELMGKEVGHIFRKNAPGISFLTRDGYPLENFIRENIVKTLRSSLLSLYLEHFDVFQHPKLKALDIKIQGENPRITFGDLKLLREYFPDYFKELVIPAVKFPSGEVFIFNSEQTPDVEIALACRASASIPVMLEPVEIEINGVNQKFMDGGMYDNLPTDYFDLDENGAFTKNKLLEQTLVFAFGEGFNNKKNQVFQALYGQQWDHVVTEETLENILEIAIEVMKQHEKDIDSAKSFTKVIQLVLKEYVRRKLMTHSESKAIMKAMEKSIKEFWLDSEIAQKRPLAEFVKEKMKPVLYDANFLERLKRDVLVETLGDLNTSYKNTQQKERGYQKLRSEYALRTVELRVGNIKTTDFNKATKLARIMDSLGYLDTVNYITNHELHDSKFNAEQFYIELVKKFETIHRATLLGAGKNPSSDPLIKSIHSLKGELEKTLKTELQNGVKVVPSSADNSIN